MSRRSEHIDRPFQQGYWSIQLNSRSDVDGPRFICHAANEREARRRAETLARRTDGVLGFAFHRLDPSVMASEADLPPLGGYRAVTDPQTWFRLSASHMSSKDWTWR